MLIVLFCLLGSASAAASARVVGFEAEHLSVLEPADHSWTPPVLDATTNAKNLFAWRSAVVASAPFGGAVAARNATQLSAVLSLTTADRSTAPVICKAEADLTLECGGGEAWGAPATMWRAKLEVMFRVETPAGIEEITATAQGRFVRGLPEASWGGAEWIGLANANDTASQYRGVENIHALGFTKSSDVVRAVLFVAGLGGYRATVNGRALDPTSIRASVTNWQNRTYYFSDDVTSDLAVAAASSNGLVVVTMELFKHWYGASEEFTHFTPYGPRSLKAVLVLTHANGTSTHALPTTHGAESKWRHSSGSLLFDDLHGGQGVDGRRATPAWESSGYRADPVVWVAPQAVAGPPGQLRAHPMSFSRVLERLAPTSVSAVPSTARTARTAAEGGAHAYLFTLPYEVAGFCTLLLPAACPAGVGVRIRHGECVQSNGTLCPIAVEGSLPRRDAFDAYTCRGNSFGMSAHDAAWRRLAVSGNATDSAEDEPALEAFTPSFQYSAFKYIEVAYNGSGALDLDAPSLSSLSCYRIGAGFDWTGDVTVAASDSNVTTRLSEAPEPEQIVSIPHDVDDALVRPPPPSKIARCGRVVENHNLTISCTGSQTIEKIVFASFGTTAGNCTAGFAEGYCSATGKVGSANRSLAVVEEHCIGKPSCVVPATVATFAGGGHNGQPCPHVVKSLAVEVRCSGDPAGFSCRQSCYDDTILPPTPPPTPTPPSPSPSPTMTPAERFNAVVAAARSTAIANYVNDFPTDSPQEEKRGWCGDSLAAHRTLAAFFDMRAAWIKWTEDIVYTSSLNEPKGTVSMMAPCIFSLCKDDPRGHSKRASIMAGVAWGSILPQLSAFTAVLSGDSRYPPRVAAAAGQYVGLLRSYTNNKSYAFPGLLNITSAVDGYNVGERGWPASSYGDWCPVNSAPGCTSVSALLNSVYFILDADAALSLRRMVAKTAGAGAGTGAGTGAGAGAGADDSLDPSGDGSPSEAQLASWIAQARSSFSNAFLHRITVDPTSLLVPSPPNVSFAGLAFRDPHPANITHHGNANVHPSAQVEAAAGMAAMDSALGGGRDIATRAALSDMLAALVLNVSTAYSAVQVGGVIDMAQIGRSLISYGRPDAIFALISADGRTSFSHMAQSTGTMWAHPGAGDGESGRCASHNHIMQAGSIGEAVFGIGGITPSFLRGEMPDGVTGSRGLKGERQGQAQAQGRLLLAPVPWLADAPRGAAAWRAAAGIASTSWAAHAERASGRWSVWVNVTIPVGAGGADVEMMLPQSAQPSDVCAWECGFTHPTVASFESHWISFGSSVGYRKVSAVVPSDVATAAPSTAVLSSCKVVWHSGAAAHESAVGIASVAWTPALAGSAMFPALTVAASSGSYAFFAQSC